MANLLPPLPQGVAPGSGYWNDWYEKMRTVINTIQQGFSWGLITGTPTTLSGYGITDAEKLANKNISNGYAGLNSSSRTIKGVDTTDNIIVDLTTNGLVLKSPNGHYWKETISDLGIVTWTDLGTTKP